MVLTATESRTRAVERGIRLESFTIAYNTLEAAVALVSGFFAGSIALVGFGLDSLIEVTSGGALLWRLRADQHDSKREHAEASALRIVGFCFLALALYVAYDAARSLVLEEQPGASIPGIILTATSLIVMPWLARAKRRVAGHIESASLVADAKQTEFCAYLSAIVLGGLILNALFGWWWADPIAGLIMAPVIFKEGVDALRGKACCGGQCSL
jgi:divalent metal cation (Fe/Co/Zn/Cd) transporter